MTQNSMIISDKIKKYLVRYNDQILFDELSDAYLRRAGLLEILSGIPVPITPDGETGLTTLSIALGMARVIGADPEFRHAERYLRYFQKCFGNGFLPLLVSEGAKAGGSGSFELACIYFRAALQIDPVNLDALYLYGRACKDAYEEEGREEEYVGSFKAQSIEIFETLTLEHPGYAMGYYFLGYSYLNLGLYVKAELTWEEFLRLTDSADLGEGTASMMEALPEDEIEKLREEIEERLRRLREPVVIEKGVNRILAGDYAGGREILEEYTEGPYHQWWPLWYYLGIAAGALGEAEESLRCLKQALRLTPSNTEIMREMIHVYEATGDREQAEKYRKKIRVVEEGY